MGWHVIKIPDRTYHRLKLVVKGIARGSEPDVAVSELDLVHRGKSRGPGPARYVTFTQGSDCGCSTVWELLAASGRRLAATVDMAEIVWDPQGRFFAGVESAAPGNRLWVFDSTRGQFVLRKPVPESVSTPYWAGDRLFEFKPQSGEEPPRMLWRVPPR